MLDYNLNHGGYARLRRRDEKGWRNGVPCIHRIGIAGDCIEREISEVDFILPAILPIEAA
mgnify:CR=1 FL=1